MRNEQITHRSARSAASWGSSWARQSRSAHAEARDTLGDFALALERDGSDTAVLVLAGELDLYRAPAIEDALAEAMVPPSLRHALEWRSGL